MEICIKKLSENAKLPTRATGGSAGADLYACLSESVTINPGELKLIPTGVAIALPDSRYAAFLYARSGLGVKHGICLSNGVGVIDSDYQFGKNDGDMMLALSNTSENLVKYKAGDRICQAVFMIHGITSNDKASGDRTGGIGSTN
jgi:dUTP pyrophosphatase